MNPIGRDEEITSLAPAIGKDRRNALRILLDPCELRPGAITVVRQGTLERTPEARPGARDPLGRQLVNDVATAVETDARGHLDADRSIEADPHAPQHREQLRPR